MRHEQINVVGLEVKGQGHTRPKLFQFESLEGIILGFLGRIRFSNSYC